MTTGTRKRQAPKGTRDFYPADMAVRRHIEKVWREVSINHGFEEIDGPTFEHTDLYTVKSGPGIVSEMFGVFSGKDEAELEELKRTGRAPFALRPEFTPTLARMVAARAAELPRPIKWFSMPTFFRAERPQRGRLREFQQWNADMLGDESPQADAEVIATAVDALERLGFGPSDVQVLVNDRRQVSHILRSIGIAEEIFPEVLALLDAQDRLTDDQFRRRAAELSIDIERLNSAFPLPARLRDVHALKGEDRWLSESFDLLRELQTIDLDPQWYAWDFSIVRGLAYYTGTVFEIHEASGAERAIAGGGRYDKLVELFGGPPTPAVGFAMGDVVLSLILRDKGLLKPADEYLPRPHVFVISAGDEPAEKEFRPLVARLRREGFHARHSYKTTKNVGKLLGEAGKARAMFAVILGRELAGGHVVVKDLDGGGQREVARGEDWHGLVASLHAAVREREEAR
jgi:histidyl-tRNA synthetase